MLYLEDLLQSMTLKELMEGKDGFLTMSPTHPNLEKDSLTKKLVLSEIKLVCKAKSLAFQRLMLQFISSRRSTSLNCGFLVTQQLCNDADKGHYLF